MTASTTRCWPALLLALLAAFLLAVPLAAVSPDWTAAPPAFDIPVAQLVEELATEKPTYTDPLIEASPELATVVGLALRRGGCEPSGCRLGTDLGAVAARAPPFA